MKFISLATISMATLICWDAFIPIMPNLSQAYHVKPELMTYGITVFALSYIISAQFTSYFIDKYSPRKIVPYGLLCASLINAIFIFIHNFYLFLILRSLLGISLSVTISINSIINQMYSKEESIKIFSYLNSSIGLGLVVAPLIGIQISEHFNYNFVFLFQALYCFICYCCFKQSLKRIEKFSINSNFKLTTVMNLLLNNHLIYISVIRTLSYLPHFIFVTFSSIFVLSILKLNTNTYSLIMSILGLSCIFGGYLSNAINRKIGIKLTILLGVILINCGSVLFIMIKKNTLTNNVIHIIIVLCVYLLLISLGRSLLSPFCSKVLIEKCSTAISSASALFMIYMYSCCSLLAALISQTNDLKNAICYSSIVYGAILIMVVPIYINTLYKSAKESSSEFYV